MHHWSRYLAATADEVDETLPVAPDSPTRIVEIVPSLRRIAIGALIILIACSVSALVFLEAIARGMANGH